MVGFKAEFGLRRDELRTKATEFLKRKELNMLVANDVEKDAFGEDETDIIVATSKSQKEFGKKPKPELASYIWDEIELVRREFLL
jgi:phosphopantothenoylcysteine synthetase/decarboxylase